MVYRPRGSISYMTNWHKFRNSPWSAHMFLQVCHLAGESHRLLSAGKTTIILTLYLNAWDITKNHWHFSNQYWNQLDQLEPTNGSDDLRWHASKFPRAGAWQPGAGAAKVQFRTAGTGGVVSDMNPNKYRVWMFKLYVFSHYFWDSMYIIWTKSKTKQPRGEKIPAVALANQTI